MPKTIVSCMKGDVYPVESDDGNFINQVLDAHWGVLNDDDVRSYSCLFCLMLSRNARAVWYFSFKLLFKK